MKNVIEFPVPVREVVVIKLYMDGMLQRYALVIVDPELGELYPSKYLTGEQIKEITAALQDDAINRGFGFEVQDFSTTLMFFIQHNDNRPPEDG